MSGPLTLKLGGVAGEHAEAVALVARRAEPGWVIVHGGGIEVDAWSRRLGITPQTAEGLRVTDDATLPVAVAVLRGLVNARLVARLGLEGAAAVGVSGVDGALLRVRRAAEELGAVGHIDEVRPAVLDALAGAGMVPVVAPLAADADGGLVNVNADEVAGAIGAARGGRLLLLTDVPGVQRDGEVLDTLGPDEARAMLDDGSASSGMRPKLRAALAAAEAGCEVRILDGRDPASLAAALDGEPVGTAIIPTTHAAGAPS